MWGCWRFFLWHWIIQVGGGFLQRRRRTLHRTLFLFRRSWEQHGPSGSAIWLSSSHLSLSSMAMCALQTCILKNVFTQHIPGGRGGHSDGRRPRRMDTSTQVPTISTWHQHHDIITIIFFTITITILMILLIIISFHYHGQDFVGAAVGRRDTCQLRTSNGWPRRPLPVE